MNRWVKFLGDCLLAVVFIVLGSYIGCSLSLYLGHRPMMGLSVLQPVDECVEVE